MTTSSRPGWPVGCQNLDMDDWILEIAGGDMELATNLKSCIVEGPPTDCPNCTGVHVPQKCWHYHCAVHQTCEGKIFATKQRILNHLPNHIPKPDNKLEKYLLKAAQWVEDKKEKLVIGIRFDPMATPISEISNVLASRIPSDDKVKKGIREIWKLAPLDGIWISTQKCHVFSALIENILIGSQILFKKASSSAFGIVTSISNGFFVACLWFFEIPTQITVFWIIV